MVGPVGSVEQTGRRCPTLGQQALWIRDALLLQMGEDLVDHCRILDAGNHIDSAAAGTAGFDVDIEYAPSSKADVGAFIL